MKLLLKVLFLRGRWGLWVNAFGAMASFAKGPHDNVRPDPLLSGTLPHMGGPDSHILSEGGLVGKAPPYMLEWGGAHVGPFVSLRRGRVG